MNSDELTSWRSRLQIQMTVRELEAIARALDTPCNFLVFGMGNDSILWHVANANGRTAFIEDDPDWFARVTGAHPYLEAHRVEYGTTRTQWKALLDRPEALALPLPRAVLDTAWDVVLVDGPAGYEDNTPGRMKSIYMASRLVRDGGDVFIHDAERLVERAYAGRYLARSTIVSRVVGRALLKQYRIAPGGGDRNRDP